MSQSLTSMVTYEEVKHVAFQIRGSCVPGSDMFIGLFYHRLWDVIGTSVLNVVKSFFSTCKLTDTLNYTDITLTPKVSNPTFPSEFCPISLCNFNYKVFPRCFLIDLRLMCQKLLRCTKVLLCQDEWFRVKLWLLIQFSTIFISERKKRELNVL